MNVMYFLSGALTSAGIIGSMTLRPDWAIALLPAIALSVVAALMEYRE